MPTISEEIRLGALNNLKRSFLFCFWHPHNFNLAKPPLKVFPAVPSSSGRVLSCPSKYPGPINAQRGTAKIKLRQAGTGSGSNPAPPLSPENFRKLPAMGSLLNKLTGPRDLSRLPEGPVFNREGWTASGQRRLCCCFLMGESFVFTRTNSRANS